MPKNYMIFETVDWFAHILL